MISSPLTSGEFRRTTTGRRTAMIASQLPATDRLALHGMQGVPTRLDIKSDSRTIRPIQFPNPHAAAGRAMELLMVSPQFATMRFGNLSRLIAGHINRKHYFFAGKDGEQDKELVGFIGWALLSCDDAEAWISDNREPPVGAGLAGPVCAVNIWRGATYETNIAMMRLLTAVCPEQTHIYARRFYADGRIRPVRLKLRGAHHKHFDT